MSYELESNGGLAQLARALALQAKGHRFDSDILHLKFFLDVIQIKVNFWFKSNTSAIHESEKLFDILGKVVRWVSNNNIDHMI